MILDHIFQIAYVTRNLDAAIKSFSAQADLRTEYVTETHSVVQTASGPREMHVRLAFMWVGDFQYELIQPISGMEEVFAAALPDDDSLRFHHTCVRVFDWDELRAAVARQPYPIAFEGGSGPNYFLYLDARASLGHYLEYAILPEPIWKITGGR